MRPNLPACQVAWLGGKRGCLRRARSIGYADFLFRGARVVVEIDGREWHGIASDSNQTAPGRTD